MKNPENDPAITALKEIGDVTAILLQIAKRRFINPDLFDHLSKSLQELIKEFSLQHVNTLKAQIKQHEDGF